MYTEAIVLNRAAPPTGDGARQLHQMMENKFPKHSDDFFNYISSSNVAISEQSSLHTSFQNKIIKLLRIGGLMPQCVLCNFCIQYRATETNLVHQ